MIGDRHNGSPMGCLCYVLKKRVRVKKNLKKKSVLPQIIGLIFLLIILVAVSAGVTLMATGKVDVEQITKKPGTPVGDIVDAEKICNQQIRGQYGRLLSAIENNERSGRYDKSSGDFRLFYRLDIFRDETRRTGTQVVYATCYIAAANGSVSQMEFLDQESQQSSGVSKRDDTNFIGL